MTTVNQAGRMILVYVLWFISCGLCLLDLYFVAQAFGAVVTLLGATMWNFPALNRGFILLLGVLAVIFFFVSEHYYKKANEVGLSRLLRLFGWVTLVQVGILALVYGLASGVVLQYLK